MSIIDFALTQTATLERKTGTDKRGAPQYGSPTTISVRWLQENKLTLTDDGREVTSTAKISTKEKIDVGDRVTDQSGRKQDVIQVRDNYDTGGRFSHYVARLL